MSHYVHILFLIRSYFSYAGYMPIRFDCSCKRSLFLLLPFYWLYVDFASDFDFAADHENENENENALDFDFALDHENASDFENENENENCSGLDYDGLGRNARWFRSSRFDLRCHKSREAYLQVGWHSIFCYYYIVLIYS